MREDVTLRLSIIAPNWNKQLQKAIIGLHDETRKRGNLVYFNHARIQLEIEHTNERAEWHYKTCCEVWEIQGRRKGRAFFRAIFDGCLILLFATCRSCLQGEFDRRALLQRRVGGNSSAAPAFTMQSGKLKAEWNTRLEIATRVNENQERLTRERETQAIRAKAEQALPVSPSKFAGTPSIGDGPDAFAVEPVTAKKFP